MSKNQWDPDQKSGADENATAAKEGAKSAVAELKEGVVEIRTTASEARSSATERAREVASELGKEAGEVVRRTKHVAEDLREAAVEAAIEAEEEVVEVVQQASDKAKTALRELAPRIRRATRATGTIAANNAVPVSLMGFGVGWLLVRALRGAPLPSARSRAPLSQGKLGGIAHDAGQRAQKVAHDAGERVQKVAHDSRQLVGELAERSVHRVEHARDTVTRQATRLSEEAQAQFSNAKDASSEFAHEHPFAMIALSVGFGVGTSLLLPPTPSENRLLGPQRQRPLENRRDMATRIADAERRSNSERYPH